MMPLSDAFAGLGAFHLLVVLHLEIVELLFEAADDLVDLVADRATDQFRSGRRPSASLRSSVLVILRLAGMMISPVSLLTTSSGIFSPSRMLLKRLRQLVAQLVHLLLVIFLDLLGLALVLGRRSAFVLADPSCDETFTSMTMP